MKYLIVGLGNMGSEYENTRHNIGFKTLDAFAEASNVFFVPDKLGNTASLKFKGRNLTLLKPATYMNLSGKAVAYWLQKLKLPVENLLVITDDLALPFGTLRLKKKGSDGGHNGLKSINENLQTQNYSRLRFGVGNEFSSGKQVAYVLGEWNEEEATQLNERLQMCTEIIRSFVSIGADRTMSAYNGK